MFQIFTALITWVKYRGFINSKSCHFSMVSYSSREKLNSVKDLNSPAEIDLFIWKNFKRSRCYKWRSWLKEARVPILVLPDIWNYPGLLWRVKVKASLLNLSTTTGWEGAQFLQSKILNILESGYRSSLKSWRNSGHLPQKNVCQHPHRPTCNITCDYRGPRGICSVNLFPYATYKVGAH